MRTGTLAAHLGKYADTVTYIDPYGRRDDSFGTIESSPTPGTVRIAGEVIPEAKISRIVILPNEERYLRGGPRETN